MKNICNLVSYHFGVESFTYWCQKFNSTAMQQLSRAYDSSGSINADNGCITCTELH